MSNISLVINKELKMTNNLLELPFTTGPSKKLPHQTVHEAFMKQAQVHPEMVAAEHRGKKLTYSELDILSDHLKEDLIQMGVKPGDRVGLFLERSLEMLVGILGILKAGAAYIPQDARITPAHTLLHMAQISNVKIIITLNHLIHRIPQTNGLSVLKLDLQCKAYRQRAPIKTPRPINNPYDVCFILFTSGTTGLPNGVQVGHKNVCNIIHTNPGNLGVVPGQTVSQILNISFDMCAWEIFVALSHGARLFIRDKNISEAIANSDVVIATPSILATINPSKNSHVKVVAVAGEPCPKPLADSWSRFSDFYNCCGPTETTIVNTMGLYKQNNDKITIGKPTPNNTVYILDEDLNPLSFGEVGEMWAGGDCVTLGYINNEKLNRDRYRPDPFLGNGKLMFRTRDLGRWTDTGELEHFGRIDDQVKIKGFRVELDSISSVLERMAGSYQAITLKLDNQNLVSFVTPKTVCITEAKKAIEEILPYYCVPNLIIPMDELPKTKRGKVDKKLLTAMAVKKQDKMKQQRTEQTMAEAAL